MIEDLYAKRKRTWARYVASINYAVRRYAESELKPSASAIDKYRKGLEHYAKILENAASPRTKRER